MALRSRGQERRETGSVVGKKADSFSRERPRKTAEDARDLSRAKWNTLRLPFSPIIFSSRISVSRSILSLATAILADVHQTALLLFSAACSSFAIWHRDLPTDFVFSISKWYFHVRELEDWMLMNEAVFWRGGLIFCFVRVGWKVWMIVRNCAFNEMCKNSIHLLGREQLINSLEFWRLIVQLY